MRWRGVCLDRAVEGAVDAVEAALKTEEFCDVVDAGVFVDLEEYEKRDKLVRVWGGVRAI